MDNISIFYKKQQFSGTNVTNRELAETLGVKDWLSFD